MTELGRFIVVEGLEGAGKTSTVEIIKRYLAAFVPHLVVTREPGGTHLGESLRTLIKEEATQDKIDSRAELLIMYASRVQLIEQIIKPALLRGDWVLSDRFELSSYAYQGGGRDLDTSLLDSLSNICLRDFKPDLTLFLDVNPQQGLERIKKRGKTDRIEQESLIFFQKVAKAYHERIKTQEDIRIIDAEQPLEQVKEAIILHLQQFLQEQK